MAEEQQEQQVSEEETVVSDEQLAQQPPKASATPASFLIIIVLLAVLGAAGAGGYFIMQLYGAVARTDSDSKSSIAAIRQELQQQTSSVNELQTTIKQQQASLQQSIQVLHDELGRGRLGRVVAEVEYLLRQANYRIQLQRDVASAVSALEAADSLLKTSGEPALLTVRDSLIAELNELRATEVIDISGLSLTLANMAATVETLPLAGSSNRRVQQTGPATDRPAVEGWRDMARAMWGDIKGLVEIRRHDQPVAAMLSAKESLFLYENLRLKLEAARLALLRQDQALFRANLATVRQWLDKYFDNANAAVSAMQTLLGKLEAANIAPVIPVVDTTFEALRQYRQKKGAGDA